MPLALVVGASGYTGRAVVARLRALDIPTVAHVRPDSSQRSALEPRFSALGATVDTTPWDPQAMRDTLTHLAPSHVFALLGTTRARGRQAAQAGRTAETYQTVDRDLTNMLIDACAPLRPRFIYLSSMGAGAPRRNAYLQARHQVEAALEGHEAIIARPSFISGPDRDERRIGERVAASVTGGALGGLGRLGLGRLRDRYAPMDAATLARALVVLALGEQTGVFEADALRALSA